MSDSWRPKSSRDARTARAVLSMAPGSMEGRLAQASPARDSRKDEQGVGDVTEVIFSYPSEPVAEDESPPYYNRVPLADAGSLIISTRTAGTTQSSLALMVNRTVVFNITLPAGERKVEDIVDGVVIEYGDLISVKFTAVGAALSGITVQLLLEE